MTDREKLLALIQKAKDICANDYSDHTENEYIADTLLDNGVTFATDICVGSKWISVEDRLPEQTLRCLVYQKSPFKYEGLVSIATFTTSFRGLRGDPMNGKQVWYKYDYLCGDCVIDDITHWIPLPEPPKEG